MGLAQLVQAAADMGLPLALCWHTDALLQVLDLAGDEALVASSWLTAGAVLVKLCGRHPYGDRTLAAHRLALAGQPTTYDLEHDGTWYRVHLVPSYREGTVAGILGRAFTLPASVAGSVMPPLSEDSEQLEVVGRLRRDVPLADAEAGDRVVFRPGHADPDRECVVMHSTSGEHFVQAIEAGDLEITGCRPASAVRDAHRLLLRRLRRRPDRLALVR